MNRIDSLFAENRDPAAFAGGYLRYLAQLCAKMDPQEIGRFMEVLLQARERGARIFFLGNGGSAATASHFANDIAIGTRSREKPFRAISLCDNLAMITAIGNDYGYEQIFLRQLENQMQEGDVVVAISASGNSPNVLQAVEFANSRGNVTVGLTGFAGGRLREIVGISVHVPTLPGEYGPVEDLHMIIDHLVGAFLMQRVRQEISVLE
ncbi:D-sedoheptulose-7-phosphate isomerase [Candidatus Magnetaquicoccus inordinatus]|uniref:D-sedoheptulose-7-phosphate isomerase n=1 Tax=Candidatus Magnetaquicoccus inordinatus TaxID=2496818 RepID=UPI00102AB04E|nr:SIS domain-containing protein [Candidatus Magnetaquicoccus inordinatus]